MKILYVPPAIGEEKRSISGGYTPLENNILQYRDHQVIYVLGTACLDGSCCGYANWNYIQVIGYLSDALKSENIDTTVALELETIENRDDRNAIRQILSEKYPGSRIEYG